MNVLLAWELGAGYGHVAKLRPLARQLRELGHRCVFALRDLATAEDYLDPAQGPVLQAPIRSGNPRQPVKTQVSYASLLNNVGFDDAVGLAGRIRAWRQLMLATRSELLFADHSPTALVAAHTLGLPAVTFGSGFLLPPRARPFPSWEASSVVTPDILQRNEASVLERLNAALQRLQQPAWASLQQLFDGVGRGLATYAELDHYGTRADERYLGMPDMATGAAPVWPEGTGPRLFAYLRPFPALPALLQALARCGAQVLVRIADLPASALRPYENARLRVIDSGVDMQQAAQGCDAFVNYGAHGTLCEMLLAGRPGLLLPVTTEQRLVSQRMQGFGAALLPPPGEPDLAPYLARLIEDPAPHAAAAAFARRYAGVDRAGVIPSLARTGLELAARRTS